MRANPFLLLFLTGCRCCADDESSEPTAGALVPAEEVLADLNITSRCDSLIVEVDLSGSIYGCEVETMANIAWFSDPEKEFGTEVLSLVVLEDNDYCGQSFPALETLAEGVELHPSEWSAVDDKIAQHGMAESTKDAEARIGVDFSFPRETGVEKLSGSLHYLSGQSDSDYWDGYGAEELMRFSGAEVLAGSVTIPGC